MKKAEPKSSQIETEIFSAEQKYLNCSFFASFFLIFLIFLNFLPYSLRSAGLPDRQQQNRIQNIDVSDHREQVSVVIQVIKNLLLESLVVNMDFSSNNEGVRMGSQQQALHEDPPPDPRGDQIVPGVREPALFGGF